MSKYEYSPVRILTYVIHIYIGFHLFDTFVMRHFAENPTYHHEQFPVSLFDWQTKWSRDDLSGCGSDIGLRCSISGSVFHRR